MEYEFRNREELDEIKLISMNIMNRYNIRDMVLVNKLANLLFVNGIGVDKFSSEYDDSLFGLDEIVYYLLNKIEMNNIDSVDFKKNKVINFEVARDIVMLRRKFRGK